MRTLKFVLLYFFLGFFSCTILKSAKEIIAIKNLKISLARVEILNVDLEGINTLLYFNVQNPNEVDAKIATFDFDVLVNSEKIAEGRLNRVLTIPSRGEKSLKIPVYIPFSSMSMGVKKVLLNRRAEVGIKGYAVIRTSLGSLRFKVIDKTRRIF